MKLSRRFLIIFAILLLVIVGGIMLILMSIQRSQDWGYEPFGDNPSIIMTNDWVNTAVFATATAKSWTATPSQEPRS